MADQNLGVPIDPAKIHEGIGKSEPSDDLELLILTVRLGGSVGPMMRQGRHVQSWEGVNVSVRTVSGPAYLIQRHVPVKPYGINLLISLLINIFLLISTVKFK